MKRSSGCKAVLLCLLLLGGGSSWGHGDGKTPEQLGEVSFPTSCAPAVQVKFTRAVALLHSFWFNEGEKAFREVVALDPSCAIANWGIAAILINNTFVGGASSETAKKAQAAIDQGRAAGAKTERERMYLEAVAQYWHDFSNQTHGARMKALANAFEELAKRFPEDDEAKIFSAIYLTATQSPMDSTFASALKAAALLEPQMVKHPEHPGVAHYLIHSYDYPPIAAKGLAAARRYADIAASAPHALHMPSHIFTRVGAWEDSVVMNRRSANTAKEDKSPGDWLHALDYMAYAYLQMGRDRDAALALDEAKSIVDPNVAALPIGYALAAMPARITIERGMWKEAAALNPVNGRLIFADAMVWYAKALGAARSGDVAGAEQSAQWLGDTANALAAAKNDYWATEVKVQQVASLAWIELAKGNRDAALTQMRQAADLEDTSGKHPVSPGRLIPARELLAEMLMQNGNPAEALAQYERSQISDPNRLRSLYGAGLAAARSNNPERAKYYYARVTQLVGPSDARPEFKQVRDYLASN
jgi:tetratricopeptide (TPR) repeat protein